MNVAYLSVALFAGILAFLVLALVECLLDSDDNTDSVVSLLTTGLVASVVAAAATLGLLVAL